MLAMFLQEKKLPNKECVLRTPNRFVFTNTKEIQKFILNCLNEKEQLLIWEGLQRLDWQNQDINQALLNFAYSLETEKLKKFIEFIDERVVS